MRGTPAFSEEEEQQKAAELFETRLEKPPEDREKIFDRFFTADRAHTAGKGTGLGLSICKRIMEMHGQGIRLLDTEEGAAFRFTLEKAGDDPPLTDEKKDVLSD